MKKRILGIDVARALAVIGMIIVNFKVVFGEAGDGWAKTVAGLFEGKAAATFVVLAGVGLALMSNSAVRRQDAEKLKLVRKRIAKRAVFLFVVGLSYIAIWSADILHFYGVYMLITLLLLRQSRRVIFLAASGLVLLYPVLMMVWDYEQGWDFSTLTYEGFWTVEGFLRNLFYNGFHPVFPWAAFMLIGLWFGRQDLRDQRFVKKAMWRSLAVFITVQLLSLLLIQILASGGGATTEDLSVLLGTSPMPPLPLYMVSGSSIAIFTISLCILWARSMPGSRLVNALYQTGQLALTFYVAHVVLGMGIMEAFGPKPLGEYSAVFSLWYALVFSVFCLCFAVVWRKYKSSGPLEWVMRRVVG